MTDVIFIQTHFLTVGSTQKNKNENTEYYSIFIPFKSQSSRQDNPIFLFFQSNLTILAVFQRCMKTMYTALYITPRPPWKI